MGRELRNVQNIRPKNEVTKKLMLADVIFIGLLTFVSWLVKDLVYPLLQYPFIIFCLLNALFLVWKPKNNPDTKNLHIIILVIRRYFLKEKNVIKSIDPREFS